MIKNEFCQPLDATWVSENYINDFTKSHSCEFFFIRFLFVITRFCRTKLNLKNLKYGGTFNFMTFWLNFS